MNGRLSLFLQLALWVTMAMASGSGCGDGIDLTSNQMSYGPYSNSTTVDGGLGGSPDLNAPTFMTGALTATGITNSTITLSWPSATDKETLIENLQYLLVYSYYYEDVNGEANAQTLATQAMAWSSATLSKQVSGLESSMLYYFNVLVRDSVGNVKALGVTSFSTLATITAASTHQAGSFLVGQVAPNAWINSSPSVAPADLPFMLSGPTGVAANSKYLFVADKGNNRVTAYSLPIASDGPTVSFVLGQSSAITNAAGTAMNQMNAPQAVYVRGEKVFVADQGNSRVLIWNSTPLPGENGAAAAVMVGDANGCGATKLNAPAAVTSDGHNLIVTDTGNHRILIYHSIPTTSGATPDVVLGQNSLIDCSSILGFSSPKGVWTDGTRLAVVDNDLPYNRVNFWNTLPTSNNQLPDFMLTSISVNASPVPFTSPESIASNGVQFFMSDSNMCSVYGWGSMPTSASSYPTIVLGQASIGSWKRWVRQSG